MLKLKKDRFFLKNTNLGDLNTIRIRHDNEGVLPDWYLAKVEITELQSKKKYVFKCEKWLGLEKEDGKLERFIKEAVKNFFS